jgi:hypothetical protein
MKRVYEANMNGNGKAPASKPHAMLGAGQIASSVWKTIDTRGRFAYHFNVFRMSARGGGVTQRFTPADLPDLARLTQLLATVISDDVCLDEGLRDDLSCLAACLDTALPASRPNVPPLPPRPLADALRKIIGYLLDDGQSFGSKPLPEHMHHSICLVARWLDDELDGDGESTS